MTNDERDVDSDLWGSGARKWLRILWCYVRAGRRGGRETHVELRRRFATHWRALEAGTWQPAIARARERGAVRWGGRGSDWRRSFLAIVAEATYWWAWDFEVDRERRTRLRGAVKEMREIDADLSMLAQRMAVALGRRSELCEVFGIDSEWSSPGLDLWDLLEALFDAPEFLGMAGDSEDGLDIFLRLMRETPRHTPELSDLLALVARATPGEPFARREADSEALAKLQGVKAGSMPERVRILFAKLERQSWDDWGGKTATALDCFTPETLAPLARVAVGIRPDDEETYSALSLDTFARALSRYRAVKRTVK